MLKQQAFDIACNLIARKSITPEDAGCQTYIAALLQPYGFEAIWHNHQDVTNIWLERKGDSDNPLICFAGHTDVVPIGDITKWQSDPFTPTVKDGFLFGRGAGDMKGGLACMLAGIIEYLTQNPQSPLNIALLLTSDEEGPAQNGTIKVVEWLQQQKRIIDYCIIGEPSSIKTSGDRIRIGRRGSITGALTIIGKQGHAAYPEKVDNPIHKSVDILHTLQTEIWDTGTDNFPPTSFQWVNIHADAGATNVIPGALTCAFNLRYSPALSSQDIQQRVEAYLQKSQISYQIQWHISGEPFISEEKEFHQIAVSAITEVMGFETQRTTCGGTSDGRFIRDICKQYFELGPVVDYNHQVNERIAMQEFEYIPQIFVAILQKMQAKC